MKYNKILITVAYMGLLLFIVTIITSCDEDQGNYDYHEIPEVTISGLEDTYTALKGGGYVLELSPTVITTGDPANLEYIWEIGSSTSSSANPTYIISQERDLKWNIDELSPYTSNYLWLRVREKTTGVVTTKQMTVNLTTRTGNGIMLMTENEAGNGVLQFISMASDTMVIYNTFGNESGLPQPLGKPVNIIKTGRFSFLPQPFIWLSTEDEAWRLDNNFVKAGGSELSQNLYLTDERYEKVGKNVVVDILPHSRRSGDTMMDLFAAKTIAFCSNGLVFAGTTAFVDPINDLSEKEELSLARPYLFFPIKYTSFTTALFYDYVHERFLAIGTGSAPTVTTITDVPGDPFPWNNAEVNRTLQFGQSTYNTDGGSTYGNCFALMRNKSTNEYYIYKFYKYSTSNTKLDCYSIGNIAPELLNAEFHAFSSIRTALYFSVGSKLYGLNYNKNNESVTLIKDFGEPITYMRMDDQIEPDKDYLYVATYSSANKGTFMKLQQGTNPDKLELNEVPGEKWTGLNKVVGWSWK